MTNSSISNQTDREILKHLWVTEVEINTLWDEDIARILGKVRKSTRRALSPNTKNPLPDHGWYIVVRRKETLYMTPETYQENKAIITPLLQNILDTIPKQRDYRNYWDKLRRHWNSSENAKIYGRIPQKNHDTPKTQFSILSIYQINIRKDEIEEYFGIRFPITTRQTERKNQKQEEKKKRNEEAIEKAEQINKLPWRDKMELHWYIGWKKWFKEHIDILKPLFQKALETITIEKRRFLWRDAMDNAFKQFNANNPRKLARQKGQFFGKYGRDIWRMDYWIGKWEDVQELFLSNPDITTTNSSDTKQQNLIEKAGEIPKNSNTLTGQVQWKSNTESNNLPNNSSLNPKKILIESIKNTLEMDIRWALIKYIQWKSLSWQVSEFSGFPSVSDGFRISIDKNTYIINLPSISGTQGKIWNTFSTRDFIYEITRKKPEWRTWQYTEKERKYKIVDNEGKIILLYLPPISQNIKNITSWTQKDTSSILDATRNIDEAKEKFHSEINKYLSWFYNNELKNPGIKKEAFIFRHISAPIRWSFQHNSLQWSFTTRYEIRDAEIMKALHKKNAWDEFLKTDSSSTIRIEAIAGQSENIRIYDKYQDISMMFIPYYVPSKQLGADEDIAPEEE